MMLFGFNISSIFFCIILFNIRIYFFRELLSNLNWIKISAILFGIGAISSVCGTIYRSDSDALQNALVVFPNYLYWVVIIFICFTYLRIRIVNLDLIYKSIFFGVIISTTYYLLLQDYIANPFFFKRFGPNNFSFLLICFTPQTLYYIRKRFSLPWAYLLFFIILYIQLLEGRRAGFGLIFLSGLFTLNISLFDDLTVNKIFKLSLSIILVSLLFNSVFIKDSIYNFSPRVHKLVYEGPDSLFEDRSFQTRLAMVEKGVTLFKEYPLTGIGLNNFTRKEALIQGDFKGASFVLKKDIFIRTSSHNSYVNILAEGGLLLFIPLIILLLGITFSYFKYFFVLTNAAKIMFSSFITMCIHFYFMNAIVNSLAWFNISLAIMALSIRKED